MRLSSLPRRKRAQALAQAPQQAVVNSCADRRRTLRPLTHARTVESLESRELLAGTVDVDVFYPSSFDSSIFGMGAPTLWHSSGNTFTYSTPVLYKVTTQGATPGQSVHVTSSDGSIDHTVTFFGGTGNWSKVFAVPSGDGTVTVNAELLNADQSVASSDSDADTIVDMEFSFLDLSAEYAITLADAKGHASDLVDSQIDNFESSFFTPGVVSALATQHLLTEQEVQNYIDDAMDAIKLRMSYTSDAAVERIFNGLDINIKVRIGEQNPMRSAAQQLGAQIPDAMAEGSAHLLSPGETFLDRIDAYFEIDFNTSGVTDMAVQSLGDLFDGGVNEYLENFETLVIVDRVSIKSPLLFDVAGGEIEGHVSVSASDISFSDVGKIGVTGSLDLVQPVQFGVVEFFQFSLFGSLQYDPITDEFIPTGSTSAGFRW